MTVVLVGYAPSPQGQAALRRGIEEARLRQSRLLVVNSSRGDALVDRRFVTAPEVGRLEQQLEASGVPWELEQPMRGREAAEEIVEAAVTARADLIVIGLRHRTAVGKLLMGSTAQRVLLDAPCPVLSIKADE